MAEKEQSAPAPQEDGTAVTEHWTPDPADDEAQGAPPDPRADLLERIGHDRDDGPLITTMLDAEAFFERGNNRAASAALDSLLGGTPSPELRAVALSLQKRIRPDRATLLVALVCALGLLLIWVLAVAHSH